MALSVRPKLTIWYISTVALLLCFFIGADMVGLRRNLMSRARETAGSTVDALARHVETQAAGWQRRRRQTQQARKLLDSELGGQRGLAAVLKPPASEPLFLHSSGGLAKQTSDHVLQRRGDTAAGGLVIIDGEPFQLVSRDQLGADGSAYVAFVALSVEQPLATWRQAIWEHALLALGLILVVSVLSYVIIKRALSPVRHLTAEVRAITAEDLSLRVDASGDRYEIGELAATFNEVIERLEDAFDRQKRFSADVAHELKTPLSVLRGEMDLALRRDRSAADHRETVKRLRTEVGRITAIVDNLLLLSSIDAQGLTVDEGSISLDHVVMTAYEDLLPLAREAALRCEIEKVAEVRVRGDGQLLGRMVSNLLDNAIKYTPKGGEVALSLSCEGERFSLSVVDSGVGIPSDDLPRLFDRFYRVDKSRAKHTGGAGLGLAIVKEIADAHGFELSVVSDPNRSTEFRVEGPRVD